jgi:hypothetical protein
LRFTDQNLDMSKVAEYLNIVKLIFIFLSQRRVYADYGSVWAENNTWNNRQILSQSDKGISPSINIDLMRMTRKKISTNVVM